jgi:hypothetical protein
MSDKKESWDSIPEHLKNDLIIQVFKELSLVQGHTRLLVLVAHGFIELMVNALIDHHLKNSKKVTSDSRSYPHSTKLLLLNEIGIIDDQRYKVFDWFRKLRNKAAHQPIFRVTKNELSVIADKKYHDPEKLYEICVDLIGGLWNQHIPIFGPLFAPGAKNEK